MARRLYRQGLWAVCCVMGSMSAWASDLPCEAQVLQGLGWQAVSQAVQPRLQDASICNMPHLQAAQSQSSLHYPSHWHQNVAVLQAALNSQASRCAFQFKMSAAVQSATQKLSLNTGFRFTAVQASWVNFGANERLLWRQTQSFGRRFEPQYTHSDAFEVFYSGKVRTECSTGRQIAQIATLRELFGDEDFNRVFTAAELSIGRSISLHDTDSILLGRHKGEWFQDGSGRKTAALGRQAWLGAPGMIVHVKDASYLDDISNQAENFVVVAVSAAAQQQLSQGQGLIRFQRDNLKLWHLSQSINQVDRRYFQRLLIEKDSNLWQALPQAQRQIANQMLALLQQPFYQEFLIYVHPMGIQSVGFHMARLLDRNPRTPYTIELALHNIPTEIYQRWLQAQLQKCHIHQRLQDAGSAS
ncbi:hypothetical protein [Vitreoscilla stercoraria]|uniref:Uncharacterized protein n=1 Tax=Vitreoscilla stercoraria TaxID=61 RepID=A0ABY4E921_VITST|nr:hypothetical protein [Vitreoscilla stercoraria]UOO91843.1 hypothetical protein LVJ81_09390 [Vitreoscilla stercoraria]